MNPLKDFIIGSSIIITAPFMYAFNIINNKNNSYFKYSFLAPIWFGLWNVISFYLAKKLKLTLRERFFIISLTSYLCIIIYARSSKAYHFNYKEWIYYYLGQLIFYLIVWNIIIYSITISI